MNIYPFAGEIKMEKVIKDGKEVIEWEQVDISKRYLLNEDGSLSLDEDGNLGIGTPSQVKGDASAPLTMGEPVERIRFIMSNQEPEAHVFAHPTTEWARVDKDFNVTHLDMELCAKGPHNAYTALAMAIWNKAVQEEREKSLRLWMLLDDIDTADDIAKSDDKLYRQICQNHQKKRWDILSEAEVDAAIRARGNT